MKFQVLRSWREVPEKGEATTTTKGSMVDLRLQMKDPTYQVKADDLASQEKIVELLATQKIAFGITEKDLLAYNSEFKDLLACVNEREASLRKKISRIPQIYQIYVQQLAASGLPAREPRDDAEQFPIELICLNNFFYDMGRIAKRGERIRFTPEEASHLVSAGRCGFPESPEERKNLYAWLAHRHRLFPESEPFRFLEHRLALKIDKDRLAEIEKELEVEHELIRKKERSKAGRS